ncbi:hypothetical protein BHE74_00023322 [Ensete ventricosum]|nr:hypothetical protein BHE74_00023322 [Ensete ventricosum]
MRMEEGLAAGGAVEVVGDLIRLKKGRLEGEGRIKIGRRKTTGSCYLGSVLPPHSECGVELRWREGAWEPSSMGTNTEMRASWTVLINSRNRSTWDQPQLP